MKAVIILALNTGMRKGEILSLKWNDVDFIDDFILVRETKSNVMRKILMNSVVRNLLKGLERKSDFVLPSSKTKKKFAGNFRQFYQARKKAGLPDFRFHDLRHCAGTYMVQGGVDLVTVSQILGHSDIKMTMRYAHPTPENKRRAVEVLASVLEEKKVGTKQAQGQKSEPVKLLFSGSKN